MHISIALIVIIIISHHALKTINIIIQLQYQHHIFDSVVCGKMS